MRIRIFVKIPVKSMYRYLYCLIIVFCIVSCNRAHKEFSSNYPMHNYTNVDLTISKPSVYRVEMDSTFVSSTYGKSGIVNDNLYYLDSYNSFLYQYDNKGNIFGKYLGIGSDPDKINCGPIAAHSFTSNGKLVIYGTSDDVYVYNSDYIHVPNESFRLTRMENNSGNPDAFETYTFPRFIVCRSYGDKIYINNTSNAYGFNYFETPDDYAKNCRIITEYDIPNKGIGRLLGKGLPQFYHGTSDKNYIFSEFTFDIDTDGNFYLGFLADSLIYKFDKDFRPVSAFGYSGNNMDMQYMSVTNPKDIYPKANEQYESKGWYTWIEYIPEKDWICRSYHKGGNSTTDGLQIYEGNVLIADIDVPVGFKPIGYVYPYLFSDLISENSTVVFYKIVIE